MTKHKFFSIIIALILVIFKIDANKVALIWGISGQDGVYLTELLLSKDYKVYGVVRNIKKCENIVGLSNVLLCEVDISNASGVMNLIAQIKPDEVYNLAAQSNVGLSFKEPIETAIINAMGPLYILEAIRNISSIKKIKFFQAGSGEIFGSANKDGHKEISNYNPASPYAASKLFIHNLVNIYRDSYKIFACNGILLNHESPLRPESFVTRKISKAVAQISKGKLESFSIGNLDAKRDWGYAGDYVEAMWLMLQQDIPDDYVIATGEIHSVREFIVAAFKCVNIDIEWQGQGLQERAYQKVTNKLLVYINPDFFRPGDPSMTYGDSTKAKNILKWQPKASFEELVALMVKKDIELINETENQQK